MEQDAPKRRPPVEELTVITKAYDLVRELTQRVGKFPRDYRFLLGDRILGNVYGPSSTVPSPNFRPSNELRAQG